MKSPLDEFKAVFASAAQAIERNCSTFKPEQIDQLMAIYEDLAKNGGSLFFSGVGKSGLIGEKLASTFASLGLSSFTLHPIEALHGDLGRMKSNDALVLISKSGTTEELLKLLPYLPIAKNKIIGLIGDTKSVLASKCGLTFDCSVEKEACIHNKAPTTSTTVTMVCGDAMAVLYENFIGLSKEQFASNHPGGILGKSLRLKVKELMVPLQDCAVVEIEESLKSALLAMTRKPVGICCVVKSDKLEGIIGESDVRRFFSEKDSSLDIKVRDVIKTDPKVIQADSLALEAFKLMENPSRPFYQLPVLNEGKLVGVLRMHDLLQEGF